MHIAIVGAGQVGKALAVTIQRAGHETVFGVRQPLGVDPRERSIPDAVRGADLAILAIPYSAAAPVLADPVFAGKIVVDATNPLTMGASGLELALRHEQSGAEAIAQAAPHVRLVKAFNQSGFENLADPGRFPTAPLMLIAGDDPAANRTVADLASAMGFDAVELGALREARLLEPLAMIWIKLARADRGGSDFAFAFTRKEPA
jgi:hypothetical protein